MIFPGIYKNVLVPFKIAGNCFRTKLQIVFKISRDRFAFSSFPLSPSHCGDGVLAPCRHAGVAHAARCCGPGGHEMPHRRAPAPLPPLSPFLPKFPDRERQGDLGRPPWRGSRRRRIAAVLRVLSTSQHPLPLRRILLVLPGRGIEPGAPGDDARIPDLPATAVSPPAPIPAVPAPLSRHRPRTSAWVSSTSFFALSRTPSFPPRRRSPPVVAGVTVPGRPALVPA